MTVELKQMRYFVAVANQGQISRAARELHLAQPALSQSVRQLERDLGVTLLERHSRGVKPTEAGRAFLEEARAVLAAAERAEAAARTREEGRTFGLELAFLPTMMPPAERLLAEVRASNPELAVRPRELDFAGLLVELRTGSADAGLVCPPPDAPDLDVQVIGAEELFVVLSSTHRLACETELKFDQISDECLSSCHPDTPDWSAEVWRLAARPGQCPPPSDDAPRTAEETLLAIASGREIGASPGFIADQLDGLPGVVAVPLVDVEPVLIAVARRAGDVRPPVVRLFETARRLNDTRQPILGTTNTSTAARSRVAEQSASRRSAAQTIAGPRRPRQQPQILS